VSIRLLPPLTNVFPQLIRRSFQSVFPYAGSVQSYPASTLHRARQIGPRSLRFPLSFSVYRQKIRRFLRLARYIADSWSNKSILALDEFLLGASTLLYGVFFIYFEQVRIITLGFEKTSQPIQTTEEPLDLESTLSASKVHLNNPDCRGITIIGGALRFSLRNRGPALVRIPEGNSPVDIARSLVPHHLLLKKGRDKKVEVELGRRGLVKGRIASRWLLAAWMRVKEGGGYRRGSVSPV